MRTLHALAAGLRRFGLVALAAEWAGACGGASSCNCDSADDAAFAPKVASLEAGLEEVQVIPPPAASTWPDRRLQLTAWYRDDDGKIISGRFNPMRWTFTPTGEGNAERGQVTVTTFPTAASSGATVKAEKEGAASISDEVTVTRWHDAAAAAMKGDVVVAEHGRDKPPSVVLLEEKNGTTCSWGRAWAFVGAASVGEQNQDPCSLSVFSANHSMAFQVAFTGLPWGATGSSRTVPLAPRKILNVRVFIAVTGRTASILSGIPLSNSAQLATDVADAAASQAKVDLDWANIVLEANRTGIVLNPTFKILDPTTADLGAKVGAQPYDCSVPPAMSGSEKNPTDPDFRYDQNNISIYYVDWIDYPTDPLHPGSRGINCHWTIGAVTAAPIIYVSYTRHSSISLTHELGHVLGLNDEEAALGEINVMHNLAPDGPLGADARSRLTIGQAFRTNIWEDSWLPRTLGGTTRFCEAASPCPEVAIDAR